MKKEMLVRFFKVNSERNLPYTLTQYPKSTGKPKSTKKNEKRNIRHFFKANSERNPPHTNVACQN